MDIRSQRFNCWARLNLVVLRECAVIEGAHIGLPIHGNEALTSILENWRGKAQQHTPNFGFNIVKEHAQDADVEDDKESNASFILGI